jgi:hypothetical protein
VPDGAVGVRHRDGSWTPAVGEGSNVEKTRAHLFFPLTVICATTSSLPPNLLTLNCRHTTHSGRCECDSAARGPGLGSTNAQTWRGCSTWTTAATEEGGAAAAGAVPAVGVRELSAAGAAAEEEEEEEVGRRRDRMNAGGTRCIPCARCNPSATPPRCSPRAAADRPRGSGPCWRSSSPRRGCVQVENAADPWLESAWFQPSHLKCENPVSKFALSNATCTATPRPCSKTSCRAVGRCKLLNSVDP